MNLNAVVCYLIIVVIVLGSSLVNAAPPEKPPAVLPVVAGESQILRANQLNRVAVTDEAIADLVVVSPAEIIINGKQPGVTSLHLWDQEGHREYLIKVYVVADLEQVAQDIREYIGSDFQVRVYGRGILLEGYVDSAAEGERLQAVANFFGQQAQCEVTVVTTVLPRGPKVALQVKVMEIANDVLESIGVTWGSLYNGGVIPFEVMFSQRSLEGGLQRISPLAAQLDFLVQNGEARVLAAPALVTVSGQQADFLAGGEIPVPVPSGDGKLTILWKEYGVKLSMLPVVYSDDQINLQVFPEVSSLDVTNAIKLDNWLIPALKTRRTKTQVDLKAGETLIIGGLINSEQSKMVQKVPILGSIPIIGRLFLSTEFQNGQSQLIIMVTPVVVDVNTTESWDFLLQNGIPGPLTPRSAQEGSEPNAATN